MERKSVLLILTVFLLCIKGHAVETDEITEKQKDLLDFDKIERAAEPYLDGLEIEQVQFESGMKKIFSMGVTEANEVWRKTLRSGILILTIVFLEGIVGAIEGIGKTNVLSALSLVVVLAITAVSVSDVKTLVGLGEQTMRNMTDFINILFPAITALTAATGAITGSAIRQTAVIMFTDITMNLMTNFFVPVIYAYIAASVAYAAVGNEGLKRVASFLKWAVTTLLVAVMTAFVGYLTIGGAIAGQTDKAALKAAKFAFSSSIPIVGKILSDAAESVLAGIGILKGTIGLYGVLAVLAICIIPFVRLGMHYLLYKLTAAFAATVGESRTVTLIDSIGTAFGFVIGMSGAGMLMLLLSVVSAFSVTSL